MSGIDLVKKYEGLKLTSYLCPAGIPTIGYGHTHKVKLGDTCTQQEADEWLEDDFYLATTDVKAVVKVPLTDDQLDALASFVFNLGIRKLIQSTLLKKLNSGDYQGAAQEFDKWVYAGGKKLNGLVKRRAEEKELFLT